MLTKSRGYFLKQLMVATHDSRATATVVKIVESKPFSCQVVGVEVLDSPGSPGENENL